MPECLNVKKLKGGLDQYSAERFGGLIIHSFAAIRKSMGLKELKAVFCINVRIYDCHSNDMLI